MKTIPLTFGSILFVVSMLGAGRLHAQGTAFTYQGHLTENGAPAQTVQDFTFALYNAASGGATVGTGNVVKNDLSLSNGLFAVTLDFGAGAFDGSARWLGVAVRPGASNGAYTVVSPRQPITSTPYAVRAANFSGSVSDSQLSGNVARLNANQTFTGAINFSSQSNSYVGSFSGNGAGVTNVDVASLQHTIRSPVVGWGYNGTGETTIPAGLSNVLAVAAGESHSLALKSDGTVVGWGFNGSGQTTIPAGLSNVLAVAAGGNHSLALKSDGTVVGWGYNGNGQRTIPAGLSNVLAVAAGGNYSLALKSDGTVVGWGFNGNGQTIIPAGLSNVLAVAAGESHSLALKSDGTVVGWGSNGNGQTIIPAGLSNVLAVAAGGNHSLALKSDGTVVGWGSNGNGQRTIPAGLSNVLAVAAGGNYSLALKSDGTVMGWGSNGNGQTTIPAGLSNVVAVAAGGSHSLAIQKSFVPAQLALLNQANVFQSSVTAASFNGNGAGLSGVNADLLDGLDSTAFMQTNGVAKTLTALDNGGTNSATFGKYYRDNSIVAWAKVSAAGTITSEASFGVAPPVKGAAGIYNLTLLNSASDASRLVPIAIAEVDGAPFTAAAARLVTINQTGVNTFSVYISNGSFAGADNDFVFLVTGR